MHSNRLPSAKSIVRTIARQDPKTAYRSPIGTLKKCRSVDLFAVRLFKIACRQFAAEDRSRVGTPEKIFQQGQLIRALNMERVRTISAIDSFLYRAARNRARVESLGFMNSQSIGEMVDQIAILFLKGYFLKRIIKNPSAAEASKKWCADRLKTLAQQEGLFQFCIQETLSSIERGEPYVFIGDPVKLYNDKKILELCLHIHSNW